MFWGWTVGPKACALAFLIEKVPFFCSLANNEGDVYDQVHLLADGKSPESAHDIPQVLPSPSHPPPIPRHIPNPPGLSRILKSGGGYVPYLDGPITKCMDFHH